MEELKYIVLNEDKVPIESLAGGGHDLEEVVMYDNLAVMIPEPFIVLDFDTKTDAELMFKIADKLDLKCRIMNTTRGYHFWFKSPVPFKNFTKTRLGIGVYADCRSYGKLSYTVVKQDGKWREWLKTMEDFEIQEVPKWLYPVNSDIDFKKMGDGDGRNQALFNYILTLQKRGFTKEEVKETFWVINNFVLQEPLDEDELEKIMRDEAFVPDDTAKMFHCLDEDGNIIHNLFGDELIELYNIVTVNGNMYIYVDGYYQQNERLIEQAMIRIFPSIRQYMRAEVLSYVQIKTHYNMVGADDPYVININNGRLNVRTGEMSEHTPEAIEFERVPVTYVKGAYDKHVDKMLNKVFCGDKEVRKLFEEMLGYCLIKNTRFQKGFMFYGEGSNGKSTVLNMIREFIGRRNISSIELDKLSQRFATAELENKLVNIGDDINAVDLKRDTGTIKKLVTGDGVEVERKNQPLFTLYNHAKLIFSANKLPYSSDKTDGFYRRFEYIPFNARFSPSDKDYDPFIEEKVTTENAKSYLLNLSLEGLQRLFNNGRFTMPAVVKAAKEEYRTINSSVLTWIEEDGLNVSDLIETHTRECYSKYRDYCRLMGVRNPVNHINFSQEITKEYGLITKNRRINGRQGKAFCLPDE